MAGFFFFFFFCRFFFFWRVSRTHGWGCSSGSPFDFLQTRFLRVGNRAPLSQHSCRVTKKSCTPGVECTYDSYSIRQCFVVEQARLVRRRITVQGFAWHVGGTVALVWLPRSSCCPKTVIKTKPNHSFVLFFFCRCLRIPPSHTQPMM